MFFAQVSPELGPEVGEFRDFGQDLPIPKLTHLRSNFGSISGQFRDLLSTNSTPHTPSAPLQQDNCVLALHFPTQRVLFKQNCQHQSLWSGFRPGGTSFFYSFSTQLEQ